MKLKFQYGSNGPIGRQLAAWQNSLFPGYVSFRRLQFHHQNRLIISLINKGANTWIITQPPYSHNFCRSKTAINNRELLYIYCNATLEGWIWSYETPLPRTEPAYLMQFTCLNSYAFRHEIAFSSCWLRSFLCRYGYLLDVSWTVIVVK